MTLTSASTSTDIITQMSEHPKKGSTANSLSMPVTTDHKSHQNYIPVSSLGLFFNLTTLFAEIGKTYLFEQRAERQKENPHCHLLHLDSHIRKWEKSQSPSSGCQMPRDGNAATLVLPTA